jgi:lysine decarboxylase
VLDAIAAYRTRATQSWHCPGHKGGQGADGNLSAVLGGDLHASDVWLDTAEYDSVRRDAEALAAHAWGADAAYLVVNGSSGANHALMLALLQPGDEVVVARDAHTSTRTGLVLTGARPVWVSPRLRCEGEVATGIDPADLDAALRAHPRARAVVLVSPSYWGLAADLRACVAVAHRHGVPVVVDEAWGAHLPFHPGLPVDAMAAGADAAVTSLHKMACGLSQGALVLVRGSRVDPQRVGAAVRMTQTTSPLLPVVASVDAARRQLVREGPRLLEDAMAAATRLSQGLAALDGIELPLLDVPPHRRDPLKVMVDVRGTGLSGLEVDRLLRERFAVAVEGADPSRVLLVVGPGEELAGVDRVVAAFAGVCAAARGAERCVPRQRDTAAAAAVRRAAAASTPEVVLAPRAAFFAPSRPVPLGAATGQVAAETVTPYPPGIPLVAPGERITAGVISSLQELLAVGVHLHGCIDPTLGTIRVVAGT